MSILPAWISYANAWSIFFVAAVASFFAVCIACVVTFPRIRRAQDLHWTEIARRVDPLRRSIQMALVLFPVLFGAIGTMNSGPLSALPPYIMALIGALGAVAGVYPMYHWMRRKIGIPVGGFRNQFYGTLCILLFIAPHLVVSGILVLCLNGGLIATPAVLAIVAGLGSLGLLFGLELRFARAVGLLRTPSDSVQTAVDRAARKLGVPVPRIYTVPVRYANAYAWPHLHTIAVTDAATDLLDAQELEAVLAHEVGHISESLSRRLGRIGMLAMPQFVVVAIYSIMSSGYSLMVSVTAVSLMLALFGAQIGRVLAGAEEEADGHVKSVAKDGSVYASALEKLHRHNLIPAVTGQRISGHPDLYDRMIATGTTPSFDRPKPPTRGRGEVAVAASILLAFFGAILLKVGPFVAQVSPATDSVNAWLSVGMDGGATALGLMKIAEGEHKRGSYDASRALFRMAAKSHPDPGIYLNWALSSAAAGDCLEARQAVAAAEVLGGEKRGNHSEINAFVEACVPGKATAH